MGHLGEFQSAEGMIVGLEDLCTVWQYGDGRRGSSPNAEM